jgi:hypothetical protein
MLWVARMKVIGLLVLIALAGVCAKEALGHFREGRRGVGIGCVIACIVCLAGAGVLVPPVIEMIRDVGRGVW